MLGTLESELKKDCLVLIEDARTKTKLIIEDRCGVGYRSNEDGFIRSKEDAQINGRYEML